VTCPWHGAGWPSALTRLSLPIPVQMATLGPPSMDPHRRSLPSSRPGRPATSGLAVGDRGGLHDQPAVHAVGVDELPEEPRLVHARLPDHGVHLAMPQAGPVEGA
jgi:hypothetical protein